MDSAHDPGLEHVSFSDHLGPHLVGQRVVVRHRLPGMTGPTGGPAFNDVLGILESWEDGIATVRHRDGHLVTIETALIVSGKAIPPPPQRRRSDSSTRATDSSA